MIDSDDIRYDLQMLEERDSWIGDAPCVGIDPNVFFPMTDDVRKITSHDLAAQMAKARSICRTCPVFEDCRAWADKYYDLIPYGIFYGENGPQREMRALGLTDWVDWRKHDTPKLGRRQLQRLEDKALEDRIPAVVDAVERYYVVTDPEERQRILDAYRAWQQEQHYTFTPKQALDRMSRLARRAVSVAAQKEAGLLTTEQAEAAERVLKSVPDLPTSVEGVPHLPVSFRPDCPNGHGQAKMHKIEPRAGYVQTWACYVCRAKVNLGERSA